MQLLSWLLFVRDGVSRGVSGASHTPKVTFYKGEYHAFVAEQEAREEKAAAAAAAAAPTTTTPGPCLVFGADMVGSWYTS